MTIGYTSSGEDTITHTNWHGKYDNQVIARKLGHSSNDMGTGTQVMARTL